MSVGGFLCALHVQGWGNKSGQELVRGEVVPPGPCPYGYLSGGKLSTQELVLGEFVHMGTCPVESCPEGSCPGGSCLLASF